MSKLASSGRSKDVMLQVTLLGVFRKFIGRFSKSDLLVSDALIGWTKSEIITTEMCFVFMFKIKVLGTSPTERHFATFVGRL